MKKWRPGRGDQSGCGVGSKNENNQRPLITPVHPAVRRYVSPTDNSITLPRLGLCLSENFRRRQRHFEGTGSEAFERCNPDDFGLHMRGPAQTGRNYDLYKLRWYVDHAQFGELTLAAFGISAVFVGHRGIDRCYRLYIGRGFKIQLL